MTERMPTVRQNPIVTARSWLGLRLSERGGTFFLDGRPVNLADVMRETNRMLKAAGAEQLGAETWRV